MFEDQVSCVFQVPKRWKYKVMNAVTFLYKLGGGASAVCPPVYPVDDLNLKKVPSEFAKTF